MTSFENPFFLIISLLFIVPLIVQVMNYRKSHAVAYLYFATFFLLSITDNLLLSFADKPLALESISTLSFSFANVLLIYIASDLSENKFIAKDEFWRILAVIGALSSVLIEIIVEISLINQKYRIFHLVLLDVLTTLAGVWILYSFGTTKLALNTPRTQRTQTNWMIAGILLILIGLIQLWTELEELMDVLVNMSYDLPVILYSTLIVDILIAIVSLLALIMALFYPETMLLSQFQILRILKLYHISEQSETRSEGRVKLTGSLEKYLKEVTSIIDDTNNST